MHFKLCAALLLLTPVAFASSVDLKTQLRSCQQISGEEQRLSCFDQIVAQLDRQIETGPVAESATSATIKQPLQLSTAIPATTVVAKENASATARSLNDEFGLKKPDPVDELQEITSIVQSAVLDKRKKLLITLENGQQWQQLDQGYLKIKVGDRCTVSRGAIGSFLLGVEGVTKTIRVRRVE